MSKLENITVLDCYLIVDTTNRRVCEVSNHIYDNMFRGSRFANEMGTLLVEYRNRIADLEAKLADIEESARAVIDANFRVIEERDKLKQQFAESEKKNFELIAKLNLKEHRPAFCTLADRECEALGKVEELNQQLAEKEKEIESLTTDLQEALTLIKEGRELVGLNNKALEQPHQDKISFCIKQLEKVKETTECVLDNALKNCSLNQSYYDRLLDEIDNQIKQLKEKK